MSDTSDMILAQHVTVGGREVAVAAPPRGLVTRDDLGILAHESLAGQVVHRTAGPKIPLYETRATVTPGGDFLLMFPEGGHYGHGAAKVNDMLAYRSSDGGKSWRGPTVAFDIDYNQHGFIPLIPKGSQRIYAFGTQPIWDLIHARAGPGRERADRLPLLGRRRPPLVRGAHHPAGQRSRLPGYVGHAHVRDRRRHVDPRLARRGLVVQAADDPPVRAALRGSGQELGSAARPAPRRLVRGRLQPDGRGPADQPGRRRGVYAAALGRGASLEYAQPGRRQDVGDAHADLADPPRCAADADAPVGRQDAAWRCTTTAIPI